MSPTYLQRLRGADVDDVQRALEGLGKAQDPEHRLRLADARARRPVILRPRLALGREPVLEEVAQLAVLGVHAEQPAVVLQHGQNPEDVCVAEEHAPLLVCHEALEGSDPALADLRNEALQLGEVVGHQAAVQPEVDARIPLALVDEVVHGVPEVSFHPPRLDRPDVRDQGRYPAVDRGPRQGVQPVRVDRVKMRFHDAGEDELTGGIDDAVGRLAALRALDALDEPVLDEDVGELQLAAVHQHAAFDVDVAMFGFH